VAMTDPTPTTTTQAEQAAARRLAASESRRAELAGYAEGDAPQQLSPTVRPGFDPADRLNGLRNLSADERRQWQEHRTQADMLPLDALTGIAGLDLYSGYDAGKLRGLAQRCPASDTEARAILQEIAEEVDRRQAERPATPAPVPQLAYPRRVDRDAERPLTGAELELLRRLPTDTSQLTDRDIDLLLDLDAEVGGTDRELVSRALGDAAERRFERQRSEYVQALKAQQPGPVGTHAAARDRLRDLIARRTAEQAPELVAALKAAPETMRGRIENLAAAEGRERAADALRDGSAAAVARWQQRVAEAEAMPIPQRPGSSSPGIARGMAEGRRRAQRDAPRTGDPFARLRGDGTNRPDSAA
jgi:hypothetical protein